MKPRYSNEGGSFIIIRDEHLLITGGNVVAAALIHIFEHWHFHKLAQNSQNKTANDVAERHGDGRPLVDGLYQWHTTADLERQLKGIGSKRTIQDARQLLQELGVVTEHRNPNPRYTFDNTIHFLFHPEVVAEIMRARDQVANAPEQMSQPSDQMSQRSAQLGQYPYITSINNGIDNSKPPAPSAPPMDPPPTKDPPKRKKKTEGPADTDWKRWVDAWHRFVDLRVGIPPVWNGAQLAALKQIREHLCNAAEKKQEGHTRDDAGYLAWEYIMDKWDKLDEWQRGQFDLCVVLKKITDIINQLRNGTNKNGGSGQAGKSGISDQRAEAMAKY